jgi:hypothetical protein
MSAAVNLSAFSQASISFWLWWDSFANDYDVAIEYTTDAGSTNGGFAIIPNDGGANQWGVYCRGTTGYTMQYITRPSAAAWHHFVVNLDPNTSGAGAVSAVYLDGVSQSLTLFNGSSVTGNFANSTLYFMSRGGASLFGAGRIAEVAIYGGLLLTADEAVALAKGFSPELVRPTALEAYWPIIGRSSPEVELMAGASATVTGATATEHPRIISPIGGQLVQAPSAAPTFNPAWAKGSNVTAINALQ